MERKITLMVFVVATLLTSGLTLPIQPAFATSVLYGIDGSGGAPSTLYIIDKTSGAFAPVGVGIGALGCGSMDFDPATGILWAICQDGAGGFVLITIDETTGALTSSVPVTGSIASILTGGGGGGGVMDVSFRNGDSTLYVTTLVSAGGGPSMVDLHTITLTGVSTLVGNLITTGTPGNGIAFDLTDTFLFHQDIISFNDLSQVTGFETLIAPTINAPPISSGGRNNAMDVDPDTGILYASTNDGSFGSGPNYLSTVDTTFGIVTPVGIGTPTVSGLDAIAFLPEEDDLEDCSVHVEWDNPTSITSPTEPTGNPTVLKSDCPEGTFNEQVDATLECGVTPDNGNGAAPLCRIVVPNFIDELDLKIIQIDIAFTGSPTPSMQPIVTCFDPTHDQGQDPGTLIYEGSVNSAIQTVYYEFECRPNPDSETIIIQLDSNVILVEIWTKSFNDQPVGGTFIPIDQSALLLAGVQSISMWMIPVVIAGAGIGVIVIKRRS